MYIAAVTPIRDTFNFSKLLYLRNVLMLHIVTISLKYVYLVCYFTLFNIDREINLK